MMNICNICGKSEELMCGCQRCAECHPEEEKKRLALGWFGMAVDLGVSFKGALAALRAMAQASAMGRATIPYVLDVISTWALEDEDEETELDASPEAMDMMIAELSQWLEGETNAPNS